MMMADDSDGDKMMFADEGCDDSCDEDRAAGDGIDNCDGVISFAMMIYRTLLEVEGWGT